MNQGTWFWPDVSNLDGAKDAAKYGEWCAYIIAAFTMLAATTVFYAGHLRAAAWLDFGQALLFLLFALGISKYYRAAALLAFVVYFADKVYLFVKTGSIISAGVLGTIFLLGLFNGIRGVFAYHKLSQAAANTNLAAVAPEAAP
jgi:hypothetical protein